MTVSVEVIFIFRNKPKEIRCFTIDRIIDEKQFVKDLFILSKNYHSLVKVSCYQISGLKVPFLTKNGGHYYFSVQTEMENCWCTNINMER